MREVGLRGVHTGAELWRVRDDIFPSIRFLPRVAGDLEVLRKEWLRPAKELLAKLAEAVVAWDPGREVAPAWPTKVTLEHEQRRRLCWFDDPFTGNTLFDLHARMTPGAGRLHFRWDAAERKVIVVYIGVKRE